MKSKHHLRLLFVSSIFITRVHAADVIKTNNGDALNLASSWSGGVVPGSGDVAVWDSTVTAANSTNLGAAASWQGIRIANPGGLATITHSAAATLTLGTSGIDLSAATQNLTIGANVGVAVGAGQTWNVGSGRTLTIGSSAGSITLTNGLTKTGEGALILGGTGATTLGGSASLEINGGTFTNNMQSGSSSAGRSGTTTLTSGSLLINTSISMFGTGSIQLNGGAIGSGTGTGRSQTNAVNIGGNVQIGGVAPLTNSFMLFSGSTDLGGVVREINSIASTVSTNNGAGAIFSGVVSNGGITKTGAGILTLTGANTYTGATTINAGSIAINQNGLLSSASVTLANSGAQLFLGQNGTGSHTVNNLSGVSGTSIRSDFTLSGSNTTRSLTINQTTDGEFAGTFVMGGSRAFEIVKTGAATLTLSGAGGHTLGTTISAGTLKIGGAGLLGGSSYAGTITNNGTLQFDSTASQSLTGTITGTGNLLKSGTGTLTLTGDAIGLTAGVSVTGGRLIFNGALGSAVPVSSGAGIGGTGTSSGSLTMAADSQIFLVGGSTTTGTIFNGVTFNGPVYLEFLSSPEIGTVYDVVTYGTGGVTNPANLLQLARGTLENDTINQKIIFTAGDSGTRTWNTGSGVWNRLGTLQNWAEADMVYFQGDDVVFPDIATDVTITLEGSLVPFESVVQHVANTYTFAGTGGIAGYGAFQKNNAGTLAIANPNPEFAGATTINAGIFRIADGGSWGTGSITNNATLEVNQSAGLTLANAISGTGTLVKKGTGTLTLNGAGGSYTGGNLTVDNGTLQIGAAESSTTLISQVAPRTITVNSGATLRMVHRNAFGVVGTVPTTSVTLNGGSMVGSDGASGSVTVLQNPVLNSGATLEATRSYLPYGTYQLQGTVTVGGASASQITAVSGYVTVGNATDGTGITTFDVADATSSAAADLIVSAPVYNSGSNGANIGGLTKTGAGTLTLAAANLYTGATSVDAGRLNVTGSLANTAVTVSSGATLGGNGAIGGAVTIQSGGHHALAVAATPASQVTRTIGGALVMNGGNFLDLTASATPANGKYVLVTATGGITGSPGTVNLPVGVTGSVAVNGNNLELTIGGDYATWAALFPGLTDTDPTHDPDGDGLTNFQEYAFGLDPTSGSGVSPVTAPDKTTGTFTYTRRKQLLTGLGYSYESSTSLAGWSAFTPVSETTNSGDPVEIITVTLPPALLSETRLFLHVKAVEP